MHTYLSIRSDLNASSTAFIASMFAWTSEKIPNRIRRFEHTRNRALRLDQIGLVELGFRLFVVDDQIGLVEQLHRLRDVDFDAVGAAVCTMAVRPVRDAGTV